MEFTLVNSAGAFSNFLRVLSWLDVHEQDPNYKFYIQYNNNNSISFVELNFDYNIWDELFEQPLTNIKYINIQDQYPWQALGNNYPYKHILDNFENSCYYCRSSTYFEKNFSELIGYYHNLFKKYIKVKFNIDESIFEGKKKILGVHLRNLIAHFYITNDYKSTMEAIYEEIDKIQENYDFIYVSTIMGEVYNYLINKYPSKIIKNDKITRSCIGEDDWTTQTNHMSLKNIFQESFTEAYLLGKCDFILGGASNFFLGALILHNNTNFKLFDILKNINGK